jgi:MEDS: MEthanogen/methylotroph, DcmR Sensory domain
MNCRAFSAGHLVGFFSSDIERARVVADFVREGIACDETCIVVATPEHRDQLRDALYRHGIDVAQLTARYQYIELDARTLLSQFMDGSRCDRPKFHHLLDTLMRQAQSRGQPVRAHGEMVDLLVADGIPDAAVELEELWNEFSREHHFTLLCGYSTSTLETTGDSHRVSDRIRALHSDVVV